jgi:hypothetical protein
MKAFIRSMKKVLNNVSDEMLETLFLKVDSDCNGYCHLGEEEALDASGSWGDGGCSKQV